MRGVLAFADGALLLEPAARRRRLLVLAPLRDRREPELVDRARHQAEFVALPARGNRQIGGAGGEALHRAGHARDRPRDQPIEAPADQDRAQDRGDAAGGLGDLGGRQRGGLRGLARVEGLGHDGAHAAQRLAKPLHMLGALRRLGEFDRLRRRRGIAGQRDLGIADLALPGRRRARQGFDRGEDRRAVGRAARIGARLFQRFVE